MTAGKIAFAGFCPRPPYRRPARRPVAMEPAAEEPAQEPVPALPEDVLEIVLGNLEASASPEVPPPQPRVLGNNSVDHAPCLQSLSADLWCNAGPLVHSAAGGGPRGGSTCLQGVAGGGRLVRRRMGAPVSA